jgi:hypothetical protein
MLLYLDPTPWEKNLNLCTLGIKWRHPEFLIHSSPDSYRVQLLSLISFFIYSLPSLRMLAQTMTTFDEPGNDGERPLLADHLGSDYGTTPSAPEQAGTFKRNLGAIEAFAIIVSIVIGSGVFTSPGSIDTNVPSPGVALVIWLVGGVLAWTGASTMAELGTAIPGEGLWKRRMIYVFLKHKSIMSGNRNTMLMFVLRRRAAISSVYIWRGFWVPRSLDMDYCHYASNACNSEHCFHRKHLLCSRRNWPGRKD